MSEASNILSANTLAELHNNAVDYGGSFLVGATTGSPTGVMSIVGNTVGVASGAANIVGSGIQNATLTASILSDGIAYLTSSMTEFLAEATVKLVTLPMDKVSESFNTYFSASIIEPKEFLKKLSMGVEKYQEEKDKKAEEKQNEDIQNKATSKIQKATKSVNDALVKAKDQLNSIAAYTSKGPEWMSKQVEKYSYTIMNQVVGDLNKTVEDFQQAKEEWAKGVGKAAAEKAAQPINNKTEKSQKKMLEDVDKQKKKLSNKSKATIEKALMKIKGLLGG